MKKKYIFSICALLLISVSFGQNTPEKTAQKHQKSVKIEQKVDSVLSLMTL